MTRCPEAYRKQWRPKQGKLEWQKQKEEEKKEKERKKKEQKKEEERKRKKKKPKREKIIEVKKIAKEWEIWDAEEKVAKSEEAEKLVPEYFYKWIYIFGKKQSERMPIKKLWNHVTEMKEEFVLRKGKVYTLLRKEREEVYKFILEQLRKEYIKLSKSPQITPMFFVGKKNGKKQMV